MPKFFFTVVFSSKTLDCKAMQNFIAATYAFVSLVSFSQYFGMPAKNWEFHPGGKTQNEKSAAVLLKKNPLLGIAITD